MAYEQDNHTIYYLNRENFNSEKVKVKSHTHTYGLWPARLLCLWNFPGKNTGVQSSSVTQSCPTLCDPMNSSTPGLPVHHHLPEFTQTHVHRVCDAIQPSHPLSSPSPLAFNLSQHQGLFKWVSSSHQVAKILEFQVQQLQQFQATILEWIAMTSSRRSSQPRSCNWINLKTYFFI